jgi:ferritin-like metal-binding protein YciE
MPLDDMNKLLKHELGDLLYAEKTFHKELKKTAKQTNDPAMRKRVEQHVGETEEQIANLEQAFEAIGLKPRAEKCDGALGLKAEKDSFMEDEPTPEVLEAFNLGSSLRVEHYEIAGYRSAIALAKTLGQQQVAELLSRNLEQEVAMASFIEQSSAGALKKLEAMSMEESEE